MARARFKKTSSDRSKVIPQRSVTGGMSPFVVSSTLVSDSSSEVSLAISAQAAIQVVRMLRAASGVEPAELELSRDLFRDLVQPATRRTVANRRAEGQQVVWIEVVAQEEGRYRFDERRRRSLPNTLRNHVLERADLPQDGPFGVGDVSEPPVEEVGGQRAAVSPCAESSRREVNQWPAVLARDKADVIEAGLGLIRLETGQAGGRDAGSIRGFLKRQPHIVAGLAEMLPWGSPCRFLRRGILLYSKYIPLMQLISYKANHRYFGCMPGRTRASRLQQ